MIITGICNLIYVFILFLYNWKTNKKQAEESKRRYMLSKFILEHELPTFYTFFKELQDASNILLQQDGRGCDQNNKKDLDDKWKDLFSNFRSEFIESLSAIDECLYAAIMKLMEELEDALTINLFDLGVNLYVPEKYKELIVNPICKCKKEMLRELVKYGN